LSGLGSTRLTRQSKLYKGYQASIVGKLIKPGEGTILVRDGREEKLKHPIIDPFWKALHSALRTKPYEQVLCLRNTVLIDALLPQGWTANHTDSINNNLVIAGLFIELAIRYRHR
jgi:hypothetical protein